MSPEAALLRRDVMRHLRQKGVTYRVIGEIFGVSVERVRQIVIPPSRWPTPLDALSITILARNSLLRAGYRSIDAIATATDAELLKIPNFGRRSLAEVRRALEEVL